MPGLGTFARHFPPPSNSKLRFLRRKSQLVTTGAILQYTWPEICCVFVFQYEAKRVLEQLQRPLGRKSPDRGLIDPRVSPKTLVGQEALTLNTTEISRVTTLLGTTRDFTFIFRCFLTGPSERLNKYPMARPDANSTRDTLNALEPDPFSRVHRSVGRIIKRKHRRLLFFIIMNVVEMLGVRILTRPI